MSGLEAVQLLKLRLPMLRPWRTALGTLSEREAVLVRAVVDGVEGWGECPALPEPTYSSEYPDAVVDVLRRHLVPRLLAARVSDAPGVAPALAPVKGHPMAKSGLELAVLDAHLKATGVSLADFLASRCDPPATPAARVPAGMAVGVTGSVAALVEEVGRWVEEGYRRVKVKIHPGWDSAAVGAVRDAFGSGLVVAADANGSYAAVADPPAALRPLARWDVAFVEQPLADDDLLGHAALAGRLAIPVCLDESLTSANLAEAAIALGACSVVNVKAPRVGGYLEAVRVHDRCRARGVPVWCGGMLETAVGRAANLALASLPGFTIPGDVSGTGWLYPEDVAGDVFALDAAGTIAVPRRPGTGVAVAAAVTRRAAWSEWHRPG